MTICSPSIPTKCIPLCISSINIGAIEDTDTAVFVYIKDITTGRIELIRVTSDSEGMVVITTTDYTFSDIHSYELWITLASASINDKVNITIDDTTDTTFGLCFEDIASLSGYYPGDIELEVA